MKQITLITLSVLLFLPAGLSAMSQTGPVHVSHPVVYEVTGDITVKGNGQPEWELVERGTLLLSGDVVRTGPESRVRIRFSSGSMELYENSMVLIPTIGTLSRSKDIRELVVGKGSVLLDISVDGSAGAFSFKSQNVRGRAAKSILTVSNNGSGTTVNLYQGEVKVKYGDEPMERTSSLVPGSSFKVDESRSGSLFRFDPLPALKDYRHKVSPSLHVPSGLPIPTRTAADGTNEERARFMRGENGPDVEKCSAVAVERVMTIPVQQGEEL